ncbi:MAG: zinc ABC transporter substrate-binding protein [Candidatus Hydrogenedentes bacterium]|nr:zinc ABC transporter substrate-binding protein [Candidatus Hydrogenedentota bacterium]
MHCYRTLRAAAVFLLAAIASGCAPEGATREDRPAPGILRVTCTTGIIADTVAEIGGDYVSVTALMGPGIDPHTYKASQGDLGRLSDADLILYNGLHLEGKMTDVLVRMASRTPVYAVTDKIDPALLREPPEFDGAYDPHVWFDASLWRQVASRIQELLVERLPLHRAYLDGRAAAYQQTLASLDDYARAEIARIPEARRVLVTAHDAFGYFGRAYGMEVVGVQGISTASEYGLQDLNRLVQLVVERKIPAVFVESSVSHRSIEALIAGAEGEGHTVRLGGELYSDALGAPDSAAGTYTGMFQHNVDTIVKGLQGNGDAAE